MSHEIGLPDRLFEIVETGFGGLLQMAVGVAAELVVEQGGGILDAVGLADFGQGLADHGFGNSAGHQTVESGGLPVPQCAQKVIDDQVGVIRFDSGLRQLIQGRLPNVNVLYCIFFSITMWRFGPTLTWRFGPTRHIRLGVLDHISGDVFWHIRLGGFGHIREFGRIDAESAVEIEPLDPLRSVLEFAVVDPFSEQENAFATGAKGLDHTFRFEEGEMFGDAGAVGDPQPFGEKSAADRRRQFLFLPVHFVQSEGVGFLRTPDVAAEQQVGCEGRFAREPQKIRVVEEREVEQ